MWIVCSFVVELKVVSAGLYSIVVVLNKLTVTVIITSIVGSFELLSLLGLCSFIRVMVSLTSFIGHPTSLFPQ